MRPIVHTAVDLATEGLASFEIPTQQPRTAKVWRASKNFDEFAACDSATELDLYVNYRDPKHLRKKAPFLTEMYTVSTFHELLHGVRYEYFQDNTLAEHVASEGFAHIGEAKFADVLFGFDLHQTFPIMPEQARRLPWLVAELQQDIALNPENECEGELFDRWFEGDARTTVLADGVVLGGLAVMRHLNRGVQLPDIVRMPAEEVLSTVL